MATVDCEPPRRRRGCGDPVPRVSTDDHDRPRGLGPCDVLTEAEAVAVLAMREADGKRWLRDRGLVHDVDGRGRVIAGDLVAAIRDAGGPRRATRAVAPVAPLRKTNAF